MTLSALRDAVFKRMPSDEPLTVSAVLVAIPNGWAKLDGQWVRLTTFDVVDDDGDTLAVWARAGKGEV